MLQANTMLRVSSSFFLGPARLFFHRPRDINTRFSGPIDRAQGRVPKGSCQPSMCKERLLMKHSEHMKSTGATSNLSRVGARVIAQQ